MVIFVIRYFLSWTCWLIFLCRNSVQSSSFLFQSNRSFWHIGNNDLNTKTICSASKPCLPGIPLHTCLHLHVVISDTVGSFRNPRCLWRYPILVLYFFYLLGDLVTAFGKSTCILCSIVQPATVFITFSLHLRLFPLFFLADRLTVKYRCALSVSLYKNAVCEDADHWHMLAYLPRDADALPLQVQIQTGLSTIRT